MPRNVSPSVCTVVFAPKTIDVVDMSIPKHIRRELKIIVKWNKMKLPQIKRATWEKKCYPGAKWVVVERKYNTYSAHDSLFKAIRKWFWHLGYILRCL